MKGLLITTVVALAISQSYAANECPSVDGPLPVYIPNPANCGTYYQCVGGRPLLLQCPVGTHWSTTMNRCDFPENAKCKETGSKPPSGSTPKTPVNPDPSKKPDGCPAENGPEDVLLPNPDDCGSFYKCLNGIPYLIKCPPGQEWSTELSRCDWPEIAHCSESGNGPHVTTTTKKPTTDPKDPPATPDGCPAENGPEDVLLPNPNDCGSFYKCLNGIPYLIKCPPGQEWSIELSRCDWPEIAKCSV